MFAEVMRDAGYAAYRGRLQTLLGIPEDANENQIHEYIVDGFSASRLFDLCEKGDMTPLERDQIIPLRTLKTRLNKGQPLTVSESDRLFRTAHITALAETIFGNQSKAKRWLSKPKERFNSHSPMTMLASLHGTRQVEEMLIQLAEGYSF
jgi:putative toxin-antitoxin system antitoxin component (TIGR02293 family)